MSEMRDLARLYLSFKSLSSQPVTTEEMFRRDNLSVLRDAIEKMVETSEDGKEKYGLKLTLNAIVQRTIKSLKGYYTETIQDDKYDEIKKFQLAYSFRSHEMFSNARYQCISSSVDKARRPEQLPEEEELMKLKTFISGQVKLVTDTFEITKYAWLRSLVVCRLTLYNGRRGEEPSRMLLSQWADAEDGVWLPSDQVLKIEDDAEKYLVGQFRLAYLHGKGRKFVPVLLPEDTIEAIKLLVAQRQSHGIKENNIFLFGTKSSSSNCSGWHSVKSVCIQAQVKINATKNRHRISTIYASLDMSLEHQRIFLDHMGHEAAISRDNYQCPIGIKEVRIMGKLLNNIDKGASTETVKLPEMLQQSTAPKKSKLPEMLQQSIAPKKFKLSEKPEEPKEKTKSEKVTWSKEETAELRKVFKDFFTTSTSNTNCNSGYLPNKEEIINFLKNQMPQCLKLLSMQTAYLKTRTKLFNERKTIRENINRHQNKLI
ncbi:hypothetical protein ACJMK2_038948 [Sinanodonta woodiana]|uniref:Tyr recombinase domain-containing protein n=1 Tax=Sinanodonta woodiana TaxID=1069815 RepID=A0ABD3WAI5_SINWO